MATEPDDIQEDDDVLDLEEDQIIEDEPEDGETDSDDDDEGDDHVGFADEEEAPTPQEDALVKHLRQQVRETQRQLKEVSSRLAPAEPEIVVGPRPKPADFDYVDEDFDAAMDAWEERKAQAERQEAKRNQVKQSQEAEWAKVQQNYATQKAALRIPDKDAAEQAALDTLSPTTQALIAKHADNAALFMVAVGKSPTKLAELARIEAEGDPFAVMKAVTKMEATLTTKKAGVRPPNPDTPVRGKPIAASGTVEKQLAKLEAEAEKTGDRSKIIAFKRAQKEGK